MSELDGVFAKEIVEQGLREFPNESCGVIAAADGVPVKVFPMRNADASKRRMATGYGILARVARLRGFAATARQPSPETDSLACLAEARWHASDLFT